MFAAACATNSDIMDTERMLTAAGFQMRLADTPAKLAQIGAMPQRTVTPRAHGGQVVEARSLGRVAGPGRLESCVHAW